MNEKEYVLPDMGAVLGGGPHPLEKEIRRKELPGSGAANEPMVLEAGAENRAGQDRPGQVTV